MSDGGQERDGGRGRGRRKRRREGDREKEGEGEEKQHRENKKITMVTRLILKLGRSSQSGTEAVAMQPEFDPL